MIVALVSASVALVQALVALVESHPPQNLVHGGEGIQGGLIWDRYVTHRLWRGWWWGGVKLLDRGKKGGPAKLAFTMHHLCKLGNKRVLCSGIQSLFRDKTHSSI